MTGGDDPREGLQEEPSFADLMKDAKPLGTDRQGDGQAMPPPSGSNRAVMRPAEARGARARFRWPDPENRLYAAVDGVSDQQLRALGRGEPAPEERIDLHGTRLDAAGRLLAQRIESARARGLRTVLIVHGHGRNSAGGEAVLRTALPEILTKRPIGPALLAFAPASPALGGAGATLLLLRKR